MLHGTSIPDSFSQAGWDGVNSLIRASTASLPRSAGKPTEMTRGGWLSVTILGSRRPRRFDWQSSRTPANTHHTHLKVNKHRMRSTWGAAGVFPFKSLGVQRPELSLTTNAVAAGVFPAGRRSTGTGPADAGEPGAYSQKDSEDRMDAAQSGHSLGLDVFRTYLDLLRTAFPCPGGGKA